MVSAMAMLTVIKITLALKFADARISLFMAKTPLLLTYGLFVSYSYVAYAHDLNSIFQIFTDLFYVP